MVPNFFLSQLALSYNFCYFQVYSKYIYGFGFQDGWMASLTRWTWVSASSRSWWWTGEPWHAACMESQRVGHDWATELNWTGDSRIKNPPANAEDMDSTPGFGRSSGEEIKTHSSGKETACQCRRRKTCEFDPCIGKIHWRRALQPTPVFLPGESHGQRSLVGYSP